MPPLTTIHFSEDKPDIPNRVIAHGRVQSGENLWTHQVQFLYPHRRRNLHDRNMELECRNLCPACDGFADHLRPKAHQANQFEMAARIEIREQILDCTADLLKKLAPP